MNYIIWLWLGAMVVFGVIEAVTVGFVSIWFVVGALAALIVSLFHATFAVQMVVFAVVSALALAVSRPMVRRFMNQSVVPTNLDRLIGVEARVTETIDHEKATGTVYADGKTWSARSVEDDDVIPEGTKVTVRRIEGVRLFVEKNKQTTEVV